MFFHSPTQFLGDMQTLFLSVEDDTGEGATESKRTRRLALLRVVLQILLTLVVVAASSYVIGNPGLLGTKTSLGYVGYGMALGYWIR